MTDFGISSTGFRLKPLAQILEEKAERARQMFGDDVDLRSTSALRKLLDVTAASDLELWKLAETQFYATFLSTASGSALDLLGEDLGVPRRFLRSRGTVTLSLSNEAKARLYHLPVGTLLETAVAPVVRFRTLRLASLSSENKNATIEIEAVTRGVAGDVPLGAVSLVNPLFAVKHLNLGTAAVAVKNPVPTTGGTLTEDDETYRGLLLGRPRTLWTLEAVRAAVRQVDGVRDCRLFDPSGGVDVSLSKFKLFAFGTRRFGIQRSLGSPYYFDILVATEPGFLWETEAGVTGVRDAVDDAVREIRPIGIFPNIRPANNVFIGVRASIVTKPGHDRNAVATALKEKLDGRVNTLGLGGAVLYSEVIHDLMDVASVVDVQQLRLRRCPSQLATVTFGSTARFQSDVIEMPTGDSIYLKPDEIAVFQIDSRLSDLRISDR